MPTIKWITGVYAVRLASGGLPRSSISVPLTGRDKLLEMANALVGTDDMVGVYLTIGGPKPNHSESARGCIVGAAQLIEMPNGQHIEDFPCKNLRGEPTWPIGWPVKWIYLPQEESCPELREYVEALVPGGNLRSFTKPLQYGPMQISSIMGQAITDDLRYRSE